MTYSVFGGTLNPTLLLLSSLPVILVFWGPNFFREFQWEHPQPTGALNARGWEKVAISDQYLAIARKRLKITSVAKGGTGGKCPRMDFLNEAVTRASL